MARFGDEVLNNKNLAAIDEIAAESRFTMYGTHRAAFMGIPATGRHIAVKGVVIDRVVDGKWKDSRLLMDTLSLLQQLGALPPAPADNNAT
jgi:predicted ester cyclase